MKIIMDSLQNIGESLMNVETLRQNQREKFNVKKPCKRIAKRNRVKNDPIKPLRKLKKHPGFSVHKNSNFGLIQSNTRCHLMESGDCPNGVTAMEEQFPISLCPVKASSANFKFPQNIMSAQIDTELYIEDIYSNLFERETLHIPKTIWMNDQYSQKNRNMLARWLFQLCSRLNFKIQTYFLAVNILDRVLGLKSVSTEKLAEVSITAVFIASKYEEISILRLKNLTAMLPEQYQVSQQGVIAQEGQILNLLNFDLSYTSPTIFISHISASLKIQNSVKQRVIETARKLICAPHWRYKCSSKIALQSFQIVLKEKSIRISTSELEQSHQLRLLDHFLQKLKWKQVQTSI